MGERRGRCGSGYGYGCAVCVHLHACVSQLCHFSQQKWTEHWGCSTLSKCAAPKLWHTLPLFHRHPPFVAFCITFSCCVLSPMPWHLSLSCTSAISRLLLYFLTIYSSVFYRSPHCSSSLPPNQSHMLEREAERADDGQHCVVCWKGWYSVGASYACVFVQAWRAFVVFGLGHANVTCDCGACVFQISSYFLCSVFL